MMNPQITVEADGESWFLELEPITIRVSRRSTISRCIRILPTT